MTLLLDTHALIWFVAGDRRLGKAARQRLELRYPVLRYLADRLDEGYSVLRIEASHAAAVEHLPFHHHDPFDRLLIAQALAERIPVVTRDRVFKKYGVDVIW